MSLAAHMSIAPDRSRVYAPAALAAVERLLSLLDREPQSASVGSFDRDHWAWKFRDFPLGMMQSGVYPLALAWRLALPDNPHHRSSRLLEWILAAIEQTLARQHPNGAFDAFSPYEQDPGPTLGVMHGVGEASRLLGDSVPATLAERISAAQRAACEFAMSRLESHAFVSNHWALFAVAFLTAYEMHGDERYRARAAAIIERVLAEQSPDGWYREYEGPDPGYESLGIFHLAMYWRRTGSPRVLESLRRAIEFYAHCVHPDGSVGGVYASRHTSLYFPAGLEWLAGEIPLAGAVACFMRQRLDSRNVLTPAMSDPENLPALAYTYLEACLGPEESVAHIPPLPCESLDGIRTFSHAAITVAGSPRYYAVIAASKGGVCRLFDKRTAQIAYEDAGYLVSAGGRVWTSQRIGLGRADEPAPPFDLSCRTRFAEFRQILPTPARFLLLRALNLSLFRSLHLGSWLRSVIVSRLIMAKRPGPLTLCRAVAFAPDEVRILDRLELIAPVEVKDVALPRSLTAIHMGSAKYFHPAELVDTPAPPVAGMARDLNSSHVAELAFSVRFPASSTPQLLLSPARAVSEVSLDEAVVPR